MGAVGVKGGGSRGEASKGREAADPAGARGGREAQDVVWREDEEAEEFNGGGLGDRRRRRKVAD